MPIHLNRFRNFAESSPDARIAIKSDGSNIQVQSNGFSQRLARFFSGKRELERSNKATALAFYNALRDEFGEAIAFDAVKGLKGYQMEKNGLAFQGAYSITPQTIKSGIQIASALKARISQQPSVLNLGWKKPNPEFDIARAESIFNDPKISRNWKNAQKQLLKSNPDDLRLLIQYRQYVVGNIVDEVKSLHPGFESQSVGSTALTSDYDITFKPQRGGASHGGASIAAVGAFNKRFKEIFSQESGVVFDTNVYAHDYETGQVFTGRGNVLDAALKEDQHVAALLKLRKGISVEEWIQLQDSSIAKLSSEGSSKIEVAQLLKRFEEADAIYALGVAHTLNELDQNLSIKTPHVSIQELSAQAQALLKPLEGKPAYEQVLAQFTGPIALQKLEEENPDAVLAVRNRLYEAGLAELQRLNEGLRENPDSTQIHAAQQHQISLCLFYAAEAYHTEGAITHVVGVMQGKNAISLDANQLAFSMLEQIGDAQFHTHGLKTTSEAAWISQASKYLGRVFDAIERLNGDSQSGAVKQFGSELHSILLGEGNPYAKTLNAGEVVLLLNLLGQSVKRNAIDIKDQAMAEQISGILQKANERLIPPQVKSELELALTAFNKAQANGTRAPSYEIKNASYAQQAESGLSELFQAENSEMQPFQNRKDLFTNRIQAELINAYVPLEAGELKRYFQALPNTQLFGLAN